MGMARFHFGVVFLLAHSMNIKIWIAIKMQENNQCQRHKRSSQCELNINMVHALGIGRDLCTSAAYFSQQLHIEDLT